MQALASPRSAVFLRAEPSIHINCMLSRLLEKEEAFRGLLWPFELQPSLCALLLAFGMPTIVS